MVRSPVWAAETGAVSHSPAHKTRSWGGETKERNVNVTQIHAFYMKNGFKNYIARESKPPGRFKSYSLGKEGKLCMICWKVNTYEQIKTIWLCSQCSSAARLHPNELQISWCKTRTLISVKNSFCCCFAGTNISPVRQSEREFTLTWCYRFTRMDVN